ncbi:MAG: thioredoxin family protein [Bacteroidales bacterium]
MKLHPSLLVVLTFTTLLSCTPENNRIIYDKQANQEILYGYATREVFKKPLFNQWYSNEYDSYPIDSALLDSQKLKTDETSVKMIIGTWCGDTRREAPRFIKIIEYLDIPVNRVEIIGVNRKKLCPEAGIDSGYVKYVPTFIIYRQSEEIGRIIERPNQTLEKDLLEILK